VTFNVTGITKKYQGIPLMVIKIKKTKQNKNPLNINTDILLHEIVPKGKMLD